MPVRSATVRRRRAVAVRLAIPALVLMLLVGGLLAWYQLTPVAVYGSSMLPTIEPGDVILLDRRAEPIPGTVVTYIDDTRWITHRVVGVAPDGSLVLRGDANGWDDPPVALDRAVGVSRVVVPAIGMPVLWARNGDVLPFALSAIALGVLVAAAATARVLRRITPSGTAALRPPVPPPPTPAGQPAR
jgi:signal peptidase I